MTGLVEAPVAGTELRRLPQSPLRWARSADVVVVGSGAAGLAAALTAAGHGRRVLLLTKDGVGGGATPLAQGGLAAAIGPGDTPALHQRDTLDAGPACAIRRPWPRWFAKLPARSPAWSRAGPGWSGPRCTWRAGTAGTGS